MVYPIQNRQTGIVDMDIYSLPGWVEYEDFDTDCNGLADTFKDTAGGLIALDNQGKQIAIMPNGNLDDYMTWIYVYMK